MLGVFWRAPEVHSGQCERSEQSWRLIRTAGEIYKRAKNVKTANKTQWNEQKSIPASLFARLPLLRLLSPALPSSLSPTRLSHPSPSSASTCTSAAQ